MAQHLRETGIGPTSWTVVGTLITTGRSSPIAATLTPTTVDFMTIRTASLAFALARSFTVTRIVAESVRAIELAGRAFRAGSSLLVRLYAVVVTTGSVVADEVDAVVESGPVQSRTLGVSATNFASARPDNRRIVSTRFFAALHAVEVIIVLFVVPIFDRLVGNRATVVGERPDIFTDRLESIVAGLERIVSAMTPVTTVRPILCQSRQLVVPDE